MQPPVIVYGIRNCDTVKKARAWLDARGLAHRLHDLRTDGLAPAMLDVWLRRFDWTRLLNRQGQTWRRLDPAAQAGVVDAPTARALMLAQPTVIRRPVIDWGDGRWTLGYAPDDWPPATGG